jgi:methionyl-tRNA formyltransferase
MRIVFAGSPEAAVPALERLHKEFEIVTVFTRADTVQGRGRKLTPTPVKKRALELGLEVVDGGSVSQDAPARPTATSVILNQLEVLRHRGEYPELGVVVAYGELLRPEVLEALDKGWINLHFSLLPRWRGATPVQHAVLHGDEVTGVSVFQITAGLDEGAVVRTRAFQVPEWSTAGELLEALSMLGSEELAEAVEAIESGAARFTPQADLTPADYGLPATPYASKLEKAQARIDWTLPPLEVVRHINAFSPNPGAWFELLKSPGTEDTDPQRITALKAKLSPQGEVELLTVKPAGKRTMPAADWLRGLPSGYRFT